MAKIVDRSFRFLGAHNGKFSCETLSPACEGRNQQNGTSRTRQPTAVGVGSASHRRRKRTVVQGTMALFGLLSIPLMAQQLPCPVGPGLSYLQEKAWMRMEPVSWTGGGRPSVNARATLRAPEYRALLAPITVGRRPTFCASGTSITARNIIIFQLIPDDGQLEGNAETTAGVGTMKMRVDQLHLLRVLVRFINDHSLQITPKEDLGPGRYLIVPPGPPTFLQMRGYDFEVQ